MSLSIIEKRKDLIIMILKLTKRKLYFTLFSWEKFCKNTSLNFLTYPFWVICPQFLQIWFFMVIMNAFFYTCKSSITIALHVLQGLSLPLQPFTSKWVQWLIHLYLSTSPHQRHSNSSLVLILEVEGSVQSIMWNLIFD